MGVKMKLSKREASGAVSLVILILFVQTVIFIVQPQAVKEQIAVKEHTTVIMDSLITKERGIGSNSGASREKIVAKFKFDPNSVALEELVELGLTQKQAAVIIKYREKGGVFKTKEDLKKIYVLPNGFYDQVKDSIFIGSLKNIENSKANENSKRDHEKLMIGKSNSTRKNNYSVNQKVLSIELNEADSVTLLNLPGIGPYYANKIIEYRNKAGGFICAEQLMDIKGIDSSRFALFSHNVFADTLKIAKKDLNKATMNELSSNPYVGLYLARSIIRFREIAGKESITLAILVLNKIVAPEMIKSLKHYFN